jgi:hypothetical protein
VEKYIFQIHSCEVMPLCAVKKGIIKKIDREKMKLVVSSDDKKVSVRYLQSLDRNLKIGDEVFFHLGWLIKN